MEGLIGSPWGISLRDLLPGARFFASRDVCVTAVTCDPSGVRPGDLFVALDAPQGDGHDDARQAVAQGAIALLVERYLPIHEVPQCLVPDTRQAYGELCQALTGNPAQSLKLAAVTGLLGKTTTAGLAASVFAQAGIRTGLTSSLGHTDSIQTAAADQTTPSPPMLARWLSRMAAAGCTRAVLEVSRQGLTQSHLAGLEFDALCLTGLSTTITSDTAVGAGEDPLTDPLFCQRPEPRLLNQLAPGGLVVLNMDDPLSRLWLDHIPGPVLTVGIRHRADLTATVIERLPSEQTFLLSAGSDTVAVRTRTIGDPYVTSCLLASAMGLACGIDLTTAARGLEAIEQIPGRMERIECGQPFTVVVDHAAGAEALAGCLRTLREVTRGKLCCVVRGSGSRTGHVSPRAAVATRLADRVILASCAAASHGTERGYGGPNDHLLDRVLQIDDENRAIRSALREAREGDTVLIAGRPSGPSMPFDQTRESLADCEPVRKSLYQLVGADQAAGTYRFQ